MDSRSRHSAEASLRTELLDTYYSLCPSARNPTIVAEYCFLDAKFTDPSRIVVDLATAFERHCDSDSGGGKNIGGGLPGHDFSEW